MFQGRFVHRSLSRFGNWICWLAVLNRVLASKAAVQSARTAGHSYEILIKQSLSIFQHVALTEAVSTLNRVFEDNVIAFLVSEHTRLPVYELPQESEQVLHCCLSRRQITFGYKDMRHPLDLIAYIGHPKVRLWSSWHAVNAIDVCRGAKYFILQRLFSRLQR